MDNETGEDYRDNETGEIPSPGIINSETGEVEINYTRPRYKKPFKIPSTTKPSSSSTSAFRNNINRFYDYHYNNSKKSTKHLNYLLPDSKRVSVAPAFAMLTLLFFAPVFGVLISILEFVIHVWTHKKNKKMRNMNIYYRSPLHDITSEFCSICVDENTKNKITKLQDKRNDKFTKYGIEYVRRIVT